jgi:hypothetical protein
MTSRASVLTLVALLTTGCISQKQYAYDEFLRLEPFEAEIVRITRLPSMMYPVPQSGSDLKIQLKTSGGGVVTVTRVPTSLGGRFCGTIDPWLVVEPLPGAYEARGGTHRFPDLLRSKPNCSKHAA